MTKMISKAQEDSENKTKGMTTELSKLIHSKASKQELEDVASIKSNKVDFETIMESMCTFYKQFKQALVLLTEAVKVPLEHPNETANFLENRMRYLVNQISVLIKWVMNYDPAGFNPGASNDHKPDYLQEI